MADLRTKSSPAVEKALAILEILAKSRRGLGLSQIANHLCLPRSSAFSFLLTLERGGYLARNIRTRRYMLGLKLFNLANAAVASVPLRDEAYPVLRALMASTSLTVHMAILEQYEALVVEKLEPPGIMKLPTSVGKRMDLHCTGVGKALIAYLPEAWLHTFVTERGLPRRNENTIATTKKMLAELAHIRKLGYAVANEEDELGLRCVGAPVFDQSGKVIAAISIAGTTAQVTHENLSSLAQRVVESAAAITRALCNPRSEVAFDVAPEFAPHLPSEVFGGVNS